MRSHKPGGHCGSDDELLPDNDLGHSRDVPGPDAEVVAPVRSEALRLALVYSGTATAALIDMSAALKDTGSPGLAWDADHLTDRVDALAGAIALLARTEKGHQV